MATTLHLSNQASLAIVEIAIYGLTFAVSAFGGLYNGINRRKLGFFYLAATCLTHIIGSACYINYEVNSADPSYRVVYAVTTFVSVAPLLLTALSFLQLALGHTSGKTSIAWILLQLLPTVGFALGIAGGVEYSHSSVNDQTVGQQLLEAASIIYIVTAAAMVVICGISLAEGVMLRILAIAVSLLFLVVRLIYNILVAFAGPDTQFSFLLPAIDVQIFMRCIMQYAVVMFFLFSALGSATESAQEAHSEDSGRNSKMEEAKAQLPPSAQLPAEPEPTLQ